MIREKFWFHSSAGLGVVQFKSTLTRLYATHHSFSRPEPRQIKPRALWVILSTSKSRRLYRLLQQWRRPGSKDDTHSVHLLMFVFPRRLDQLSVSSLGWSRAVVQEGRRSRDRGAWSGWQCLFQRPAFPQSCSYKFCIQNLFLEAPSLQPGRERYTATTLWCSMAKATVAVVSRHEVSPWLARLRKITSQSKRINFKSSSTKFAHLVAKARWSVRRKGDWKEIAKLKAKYSILDLPLPACAAAVSFVTTLFAGEGSDRWTRRFTVADLRRQTFFFAQRMFVKPKRMFVTAPNELLPNVR